MIETLSADSNILIYAFDPTDPAKHRTSINIFAAMTAAQSPLPMQTLVEFYSVATRRRFLSAEQAATIANNLLATLTIVAADLDDFTAAMNLHRSSGIQTFDAMLLATASRAGCKHFLSEDMQHGRQYAAITVLNPFQLTPAELHQLLT